MGTVIKAGEHGRGIPGVAFNYEDISKQADAYLNKVREQAKQIVADAVKEAAALKAKAQQEGQKAATAAAEKQVDQRLLAQVQPAIAALSQAAKEITAARQAWVGQWEGRAVSLACAIAARILRREAEKEPKVTIRLVREALELAAGQTPVRLRLNDKDHAALAAQIQQIIGASAGLGKVEIIPDATLSAGGCRVETEFGVIDQTFEAQLDRIEQELTEKGKS
jgi:flagellar assembly protein FliH